MKIAIQGERGAYSESAAQNLLGTSTKISPYPYFEQVFQAVKDGKVSYGVVPIENSLAGSIHQNYDNLGMFHHKIVGEVFLRIEHVLLCNKNTQLKNIREVISHPQALSQCSEFFQGKRNVNPIAYYDTAGAAKNVAENSRDDLGCIASIHAAKLYGLKILKRNLENYSENFTRFLVVSKKSIPKILIPTKQSKGKTSLSLIPKQTGSGVLFQNLKIFADAGINLLKIESRPIPKRLFRYMFYIDLEGYIKDSKIKGVLKKLEKTNEELKVFGSYPVGRFTKIKS